MNRIDPNAKSNAFNEQFVRDLAENGDFAQGTGADDEKGASAKKGGKAGGKAAAGNGAKITAPASKGEGPGDKALDVLGGPSQRVAISGKKEGGSLTAAGDADTAPPAGPAGGEVAELAGNGAAPAATGDDVTKPGEVARVPLVTDEDAAIGAAQKQLASHMNDPTVSAEQLNQDVTDLVDAIHKAGRGDEAVQLVASAMPANTTKNNMAAIFAMAAKNGVDLDSGASKMKDAKSDSKLNKTERAQQVAAQKAAQEAAAAEASRANAQTYKQSEQRQSTNGVSGGKNGSGGASATGPSNWDGKAATVDASTKDTSTPGGNYVSYSGPAANYPNDTSKWADWDTLWAKAQSDMGGANTPEQISWIQEGIEKEAAATGIDKRFILAVIMQESTGNVHVGTTNNGVTNPGLMQSHNGVSFDGSKESVLQMIKDGVEGTSDGDGLIQGVNSTNNYFAAGRLYNSGQMDANNLDAAVGATENYASDLANRVMGRK